MNQPVKKIAFSVFICYLMRISTVSTQCCDFETSACTWETNFWTISGIQYPDFTDYPNFLTSQPSSTYIYLQNHVDYAACEQAFTIPAEGTVISYDYFFDAPVYDSYDYVYLQFYNDDGSFATLLETINVPSDTWQHSEVACDATNAYCCGSLDKIPCAGTLKLTANLNPSVNIGLFAFDNIGSSCSTISTTPKTTTIPTTTTTPTTTTEPLPPPQPSDCCPFETNVCGTTSEDWLWTTRTPAPILPFSGNFLWTNVVGAQLNSSLLTNITEDSQFFVEYYIASASGQLNINFIYSDGSLEELGFLPFTDGEWRSSALSFDLCDGPCEGKFQLTYWSDDTSNLPAAIDNLERDSPCDNSLPCCSFTDDSMCFFTSTSDYSLMWLSSERALPYYQPPTSEGYVYFETLTNYPTELNVKLVSVPVTITADTRFRGSFFLRNPGQYTTTNALLVNFYNSNTQLTTQLDYIKSTDNAWLDVDFKCDSPHGNCCQTEATCSGYIEFVAYLEAIGGSVTYAVENFNIVEQCNNTNSQNQDLIMY